MPTDPVRIAPAAGKLGVLIPGIGAVSTTTIAGVEAVKTGCWLNIANVNDFMVAQPWLKGIEQAHAVSNPNSLRIAALTVG